MLFMVIERFKNGDARPVYERYRDKGRLTPDGLSYVSSWVDTKLTRCYQLMETDDPILIRSLDRQLVGPDGLRGHSGPHVEGRRRRRGAHDGRARRMCPGGRLTG